MRLLYDLTAIQPVGNGEKFHGGGKYALRVLLGMLEIGPGSHEIYTCFRSSKFLSPDVYDVLQKNQVPLIDLDRLSLSEACKLHSIDRFYSPLPYNIGALNELTCEKYGTIHGLRELETEMEWHALKYARNFKEKCVYFLKSLLRQRTFRKKYISLNKVLKNINIIAVSNHTKHSIISHFPDLHKDIKVFYSPDVTELGNGTDDLKFYHENYFLLVSAGIWYKNNLRALIALDQLFSEHKNLTQKVVVTGLSDRERFFKYLVNKDRFVFLDYVEEEKLPALYKNAFALMYMTLNEGFGYPPLEAMKFGIPVVASPFTSVPEICGSAALYCNPYSVFEIKNRILQLFDQTIYNSFKSKGLQQYSLIRSKQNEDLKGLIMLLLK